MKSKINLLEQLKPLPHFRKNTVSQIGLRMGLKKTTVETYISRFLKYKEILALRNGLYVTTDFFEKNKNDISYLFYLANITRPPSYVSTWAALQYYNLTTEAIYSITSVTLKTTRNYKTKLGDFSYQSIQKDYFTDFMTVKGKFDFFIASPAKALFDLLYFRTRQFRGLKIKEVMGLVEDLRIDFDEMSKEEQAKFKVMLKKILND